MNSFWQKTQATARTAWQASPRSVRGLAVLAALLAFVLVGGALTAYGGTILVVWLWVLAMGGLLTLIGYTARVAFPEGLGGDRVFRRVFVVGAVVGLALIAGLLLYRQTIYYDDYVNYYSKQELLLNSFSTNGFYGVRVLLDSLLRDDYKMFLNLFISLPYLLLPRTPLGFMLSYSVTCLLPAWWVLLMLAGRIGQRLRVQSWGLYLSVCMAAFVLWPVQLFPATHGMPDQFGLAFAGIILLLCEGYRFERLEPLRLAALFAATLCLILTRRWYMYWVLAFYVVYCAAVLAARARSGGLPAVLRSLRCMAVFGAISAILLGVGLFYTFQNILATDYADLYGGYYGGGLVRNLGLQLSMQGVGFLLLAGLGLAAALCQKAARAPVGLLAAVSLLAMALFTRTQDLGEHQSLILALGYLLALFALAAVLTGAGAQATVRRGAAGLMGLFFALNCAVSILRPGCSPLFSGIDSDTTRRTDLQQIAAVTYFVEQNCQPDETVYINIDTHGYSGTVFAYSKVQNAALRSMIVWEHSIPSTLGFPTEIWSSKYVMVTDPTGEGGLIDGVNTALRTDTCAAAHYEYVCELPLEGVTLYCYRRISPPDQQEAEYYTQIFAEYDAHWPESYSQRMNEYLQEQT